MPKVVDPGPHALGIAIPEVLAVLDAPAHIIDRFQINKTRF